ncbi:hypothetical protein Z0899 [Escherichia coli O157:H7 str. EDL933]|uniref:Uncharacterized protein n=1 Tax=Escherichia coli O157:H7 TaxID=83334 RepID=Q8X407_ECO57|nr:hypothetical protein Z0899 [Escherichia coli O157:H7 str. EDL933]
MSTDRKPVMLLFH